jgi:Zn-dependent M28 family amino/carboxypeptidase
VTKALPKALPYYPSIDSLLSLVSQDSLYTWTLRLQNFRTRYSYIDSIYRARDWLFNKFASFGIDSIWLHHYYWDSDQYNVVATVVGTVKPDKLIVVGGHYDSVVYGSGTNPYTWAPGADDNGTGTVATLEMARIIAQNPLPVTVMFVPFAQEEQGLIGSDYFASYLSGQGVDLPLMINADMIAHNIGTHKAVKIYAASSAMEFVNIMINMANTYTNLTASYSGQSSGSDHYSFYQQGYDAVFSSEGDFFTNGWHKNYDIVDSLSFGYMKEVVKMDLATLITVAKSIGYKIGDPNTDGVIDVADIVFILNYLFVNGPPPDPLATGDVNCDGEVMVDDLVFLINYLFAGGPPPPSSC